MENQPIAPNNQEPIHKRFMNHKLASVGIAIVVLAVATCIAFWQKQPVEAPTQQSNEMSDWKTYTNTEYGFELKYPPTWSVQEKATMYGIWINPPEFKMPASGEVNPYFSFDVTAHMYSGDEKPVMKMFGNREGYVYTKDQSVYFPAKTGAGGEVVKLHTPDGTNIPNLILSTLKFTDIGDVTAGWKTYSNDKDGFEFQYPAKLTLSTTGKDVKLHHSILFDNYDGGCDLKGDSELSKTLTDFDLSFSVMPGSVKPSYVDGVYAQGALKGEWAYMGAEGCGQTIYYFPISNNRTLVVTKMELQILSDVVTKEVRDKVLAVPGVIPNDEANLIINQILSTVKLDEQADPTASWKTYSNTKYGFEFKYPSDTFEITSKDDEWLEVILKDKVDRQRFGLSVYVNHPGLGFGGSEDIFRGTIDIDGVTADKVVMEEIGGHEEGWKTALYTFSHKSNGYMILGLGVGSNDQADQMVSTFKFTK